MKTIIINIQTTGLSVKQRPKGTQHLIFTSDIIKYVNRRLKRKLQSKYLHIDENDDFNNLIATGQYYIQFFTHLKTIEDSKPKAFEDKY